MKNSEILVKITVAILTRHEYEIIQEHLHGSDIDWIVGGDVLIGWGTHHCANQIWNCSTAVTQMMDVNFLVTLEGHSKSVWKGFQRAKKDAWKCHAEFSESECLNETCSRVRVGKNLSDMFPIMSGLKQGCFIIIAFQLCFRVHH